MVVPEVFKILPLSLVIKKETNVPSLIILFESLNDNIRTRPITYEIPTHLLKGTKLKDKDGNEFLSYPS